jgi:Zn-dependent oligopeptidase
MKYKHLVFFMSLAVSLAACSSSNPLLEEWDTPFGVPPFDEIENEHYLPAFRAAMAEHAVEIDAIVQDPEPATFANTIEALERSGKSLSRVSNVFFAIESAHSNDPMREVARTVAPELAAHGDDNETTSTWVPSSRNCSRRLTRGSSAVA